MNFKYLVASLEIHTQRKLEYTKYQFYKTIVNLMITENKFIVTYCISIQVKFATKEDILSIFIIIFIYNRPQWMNIYDGAEENNKNYQK